MGGVRLLRIELDYGCHMDGEFEFPQTDAPVVIAGPNGAGKSTLVGAVVRTLFGFNQRDNADKARREARRPWTGEECSAAVVLTDGDGARWRLERDFKSSEVTLYRADGSEQPWKGDGNPGRSNAEAREYRRRLDALVGFSAREGYEATACIQQGELRATELGDALVRLAAGGHGDIQAAKEHVRDKFRDITVRPIHPADSSANKPRVLEKVESEIEEAEEALRRAERAERRRRPLLEQREERKERAAELRAQVEQLEAAQAPLGERRTLTVERERLRERIQTYGRTRGKLTAALHTHDDATEGWAAFADEPLYPPDFPERLSALETLWRQRSERERERADADRKLDAAAVPGWTRPAAVGAFLIAALGVALLIMGQAATGLAAFAVGAAGGIAVIVRRRRILATRERRREECEEARARLEQVESEIRARLSDVPHADTLSPETVPDRRERYERQKRARRRLDAAETALSSAVRDVRESLETGRDAGAGGEPEKEGELARAVLDRVASKTEEARNELAEKQLALKRGRRQGLELPEDVEPEPDAVAAALDERRSELRELRERLADSQKELLEAQSGIESPVALRDRLDALRERRAELERDAEAHRRAYALLCDAYDEFRSRDQDRLVERISTRLDALSDGALGPVAAMDGSLDAAAVEVRGRPSALNAPPLSFGEFHAALFAVRLGATDFLATGGVRPPLLVDEPFTHLDERRAAALWALLRELARERQVIVATQDRLLLERWGVAPDVVLAGTAAGPVSPDGVGT